MIHSIKSHLSVTFAAFGFAVLPCSVQGAAVFTFTNDNGVGFDQTGIGGSQSAVDSSNSITVSLTTIEVIGINGSSAADEGNTTSVPSANVLVINSADNGSIGSTESSGFNVGDGVNPTGEAWIFSASHTISLAEIVFDDFEDGEVFTISSPTAAFASIVLTATSTTTQTFDLADVEIAAGTSIQFGLADPGTGASGDNSVRIASFTVDVIPETTVSGMALLALGGLCFNRKRRAG